MRRIIIDTDPGNGLAGADIDDGLAIGLALRSPELQLEALTIVGGNVEHDEGVRSALALLDAAGARDIPVHPGADRPLVQDPGAWRSVIETRAGCALAVELWHDVGLPPSGRALSSRPAAQALVDAARSSPGALTIVAIGPLTNVATAMLLSPDFAEQVEHVVVMGGAFEAPGVVQEFNFSYDPEAAQIVLASTARVSIVPLDVTLQTFLTLRDLERLAASGTELARFLADTSRPWVRWLAQESGRDGCPLHDPLAVATLIDDSLVEWRWVRAAVELSGSLTRGRSIAWSADPALDTAPGLALPESRPVRVACTVDTEQLLQLLLERLGARAQVP